MVTIGTAGIKFMNLDAERYTKTLDKIMGQMIREAAREWLRGVLKAVPSRGGFPVITGAARSTLVPLGRFLKQVPITVTPVGKWDRRDLGERMQKFEIKDDRSSPMSFLYKFEWSSDLWWYYINEYNTSLSSVPKGVNPNPVASAPWQTLDAGQRAFERYVAIALDKRLPRLADYIFFTSPGT